MRIRSLLLAGATVLALVPVTAAQSATPECLGRKATYVGTSGRDNVTLETRYDENGEVLQVSPVLVLKGGSDTVHVETTSWGPVYICGGSGDDVVYVYDTQGYRFYGDDGKDKLVYQPHCPGPTGEGRTYKVEETVTMPCSTHGL